MSDRCPSCDGKIAEIAGDRGAVACVDCGLVNPETNQPETSEEPPPVSTGEASGKSDTDAIKKGWKSQVGVTDSSDENLVEILSLVDDYIQHMKLPRAARLRTAELLMSAWERGLFEGRQKEAVTAGGVYAAGRECGHPRPLTTISNGAEVDESKVNNAYRLLISELDLEIPITGPEDYVPYIGDELSLSESLIHEAETILKEEIERSGNPAGVAASVLYLLTDDEDEITLQQAGMAAGVSKDTVWRHTRTIRNLVCEIP